MPKPILTWTAYKMANKAKRLGLCRGATEQEALEDAYKEFGDQIKTEADKRRIFVRQEEA